MHNQDKKLSRRSMLVLGAQTTAGILATGAVWGVDKKKVLRLGLTTYTWGKDWNIPTLIKNCEETGMAGLELRSSQKYAHGVELELTAAQRQEVKKQFKDTKVELLGMASGERFDSPDPAKLKESIEAAKGYMKLSHDIGGSGVRVFPNDFHKDVPQEKTITQIAKAVSEVGKFAADYGQEVRLEAHGSAGEFPTLHAIMQQVTSPAVRLKINSDKRDTVNDEFRNRFKLVKPYLGATAHFHDMKDPEFPYQLQIKLLVKAGWTGCALLELSGENPDDRIAALKEQKSIFDKMLKEANKQ